MVVKQLSYYEVISRMDNEEAVFQKRQEIDNFDGLNLYYHLSGYGPDGTREQNILIKKSFEDTLLDKSNSIKEKIQLIDVTDTRGDRGGGGDVVFPLFTTISSAVLIGISLTSAGFFSELGKDIYQWIKSKIKSKEFVNDSNVLVTLRTPSIEYTFVYFGYFTVDEFYKAWISMIEMRDRLNPIDHNYATFVYDNKNNKWQKIS